MEPQPTGKLVPARRRALILSALLLLAACGGSQAPATDTSAAADAGPPAVDAKGCTVYGDPPRPMADVSLDGTLDAALMTVFNCNSYGGEILDGWSDANGTPRQACLLNKAGATPAKPLPMMVWLHATLASTTGFFTTSLLDTLTTADLSGDPSRPGYIVLLPQGRVIDQFLPFPLNTGIGWDHWYRNMDRSSPYINVDVASIDHFIAEVEARGIVDQKRVFVSGWSEGADMATLYGLNTPGVAATEPYSTTSPFDDARSDPCTVKPFASNQRPYNLELRACDTGGACKYGSQFLDELKSEGILPASMVEETIISDDGNSIVQACDPSCDDVTGTPLRQAYGGYIHGVWPTGLNDHYLQWFRDHPQN
jgi:predicted esterase